MNFYIFLIGIFFIIIFYSLKKEKFTSKKVIINENLNKIKNFKNKKVLKYFGSHGCPHSNKNSNMYYIVNQGFRQFLNENNYDCDIEIYWSGENSNDQFQAANAQYVPTITDGQFKHVKFDVNKETKKYSGKELDNLIFKNMYDKL